jgi:hypothetical protein
MKEGFVLSANLDIRSSEVYVAKLFSPHEVTTADNQINMDVQLVN